MRVVLRSLLPAVACGLSVTAHAQPVIHVPSDYATLQAAISSINTAPEDGTIIEMAAGTYDYGTFISISNKPYRFTVRAAQGATVVLSGGGTHDLIRFLNTNLGTGRPVVFERIVFANGFSSTDGIAGAILMNMAEATFVSCTFQNNVVNAPNQGGGVYLSGSRGHFIDVLWTGNSSKNWGAALAAVAGSTVYVHNSRFVNNRTNLPNHLPYSSGGAIFATDSNSAFAAVVLRITNTRFEGNQAGYVGGAIYTYGYWTSPESVPKVDLICTNCTFVNNAAARDPSVSFPLPVIGGAVHVEDQATARLVNSRFVTNTASQGGAVSSYRGTVEIVGGTFQGNRTTGTGGGEGIGGALVALSDDNIDASTGNGTINRRSAQITARDTLFQGRYAAVGATARQGGCVYVAGDTNRAWGLNGVPQMGTPASNRAAVTLENVVFYDCDTAGDGSMPGAGGGLFGRLVSLGATGVLATNCDAAGGNPIFPAGGALGFNDESSVSLTQTTLAKNTALSGGAIWASGGALSLTQCGLFENALTSGSAGAALYTSPDAGGGGKPPIPLTGLVQTSVISNNAGASFLYEQDNASSPTNTLQYASNQIYPSANAYWNPLSGFQSVSQLNSLVLHSQAKGVSNTAPGSAPVSGALRAVPPSILSTNAWGDTPPPTAAYLGFAWTGASATLNGSPVAGNSGLQAAASSGTQTLLVGTSSFQDTVTSPQAPFLVLSANPAVIPSGSSSTLSWNTLAGTWITNGIDQGVTITPAASGGVLLSPTVTTTYRGFLVAEEGGSTDAHAIVVSTDVIFKDGFE